MTFEMLGQSIVFISLLVLSIFVMLWAMTLMTRKIHVAMDEISMLKNDISILNNEIEVLLLHVKRQAKSSTIARELSRV